MRLADRDTLKGNPAVQVVVPATGVVAGVYVQAHQRLCARIPMPPSCGWSISIPTRASSLWLKGYCHPIRFQDLAANKKIPADLMAALPPAESYAKAVFPTLDEQAAAKTVITKQWDSVVGANVK